MKFSIRFADQIVGTLVILGLAMLLFVIFMLGSNQRWFKNDFQYKTYLSSASGISVNMDIHYRGFKIGNVTEISLAENDRVEVVFIIFDEYVHKVTAGSLVEAQISPINLGNSFLFHPGLGDELIPYGEFIPEITSHEARVVLASGLASRPEPGADNINAILNNVRILLETLNAPVSDLNDEEEPALGQMLSSLAITLANVASLSETLADELNPVIAGLSPILDDVTTLTDRLSDPSGTVMSILDGEGPFYSSIEDALVSIAGIIDSLDRTVEFLPSQLPQIGVLINQLNVTISSVQDILIALANNPLLRGGIPERVETGPTGASPRNLEF